MAQCQFVSSELCIFALVFLPQSSEQSSASKQMLIIYEAVLMLELSWAGRQEAGMQCYRIRSVTFPFYSFFERSGAVLSVCPSVPLISVITYYFVWIWCWGLQLRLSNKFDFSFLVCVPRMNSWEHCWCLSLVQTGFQSCFSDTCSACSRATFLQEIADVSSWHVSLARKALSFTCVYGASSLSFGLLSSGYRGSVKRGKAFGV